MRRITPSRARSPAERDAEWRRLYERLLAELKQFGNGAVLEDDADFFLVDDDWGGLHQKLCIISGTFWSETVAQRIQKLLSEAFPHWGVIVVFEEESGRAGESFVLYADTTSPDMLHE